MNMEDILKGEKKEKKAQKEKGGEPERVPTGLQNLRTSLNFRPGSAF